MLGLVIPCYNEELRLPSEVFVSFLKSHSDVRICFSNDGSVDDTISVLKEIQNQLPSQVVINDLKENSGKAEAVRETLRLQGKSSNDWPRPSRII